MPWLHLFKSWKFAYTNGIATIVCLSVSVSVSVASKKPGPNANVIKLHLRQLSRSVCVWGCVCALHAKWNWNKLLTNCQGRQAPKPQEHLLMALSLLICQANETTHSFPIWHFHFPIIASFNLIVYWGIKLRVPSTQEGQTDTLLVSISWYGLSASRVFIFKQLLRGSSISRLNSNILACK